jgi:hypothetical protein
MHKTSANMHDNQNNIINGKFMFIFFFSITQCRSLVADAFDVVIIISVARFPRHL